MEKINEPQQTLLSVVAMNASLVLLTLLVFWAGAFVARRLGRMVSYSPALLGVTRPRGGTLAGLGLGVVTGLAAVLMTMAVNPLSIVVLESLGYSTESTVQQPFMRQLEQWVSESPGVAVPAIIGVVVIFGPAVEELVFRGAIFNGLYRLGTALLPRLGGGKEAAGKPRHIVFAVAALASSTLFALLHLEPVLLPALLILAVTLCWLFARTGSLLPPFVAHATFNSFATLLVILSGLDVFRVPI